MTEDEAKTKWCPFARSESIVDKAGHPARNRSKGGEPDNWCMCIASACMMWRWNRKPNPDWKDTRSMMQSFPPPDTRYDAPMYIEDTSSGHCGLAGSVTP